MMRRDDFGYIYTPEQLQIDLNFLREIERWGGIEVRRGGYSHKTLAEYIAKAYNYSSLEPVYVRELARIWRKEKGRGSYIFLASYALRFLYNKGYLYREDVDVDWKEGSMKKETEREWSQYHIYYRSVFKYEVRFKARAVLRLSRLGLDMAQRVEKELVRVCRGLYGRANVSATAFESPFPDVILSKYNKIIEISTRSENPIGLSYVRSKTEVYPDYDVLIIAPAFTKGVWKNTPRYVTIKQYPEFGSSFVWDHLRHTKFWFDVCHRDVQFISVFDYRKGLEELITDFVG